MSILQKQKKNRAVRRDTEALEFIEKVTRQADEYQKMVLAQILSRNDNTEYLQRYHLNGRTDRQSFTTCVPIVSYENIKQEIMRIAHGDKSPILSATPISEFLTSSGTSDGESKLMPTIPEETDRKEQFYSLLMPLMNRYMEGLEKGTAMYFLFVKAETRTPGDW